MKKTAPPIPVLGDADEREAAFAAETIADEMAYDAESEEEGPDEVEPPEVEPNFGPAEDASAPVEQVFFNY